MNIQVLKRLGDILLQKVSFNDIFVLAKTKISWVFRQKVLFCSILILKIFLIRTMPCFGNGAVKLLLYQISITKVFFWKKL